MKAKLYLLTAICLVIFFASCDKDESFDAQWKANNETAFAKISNDPSYTKLESQSGLGYIMYKEIEDGNTDKSPMFTDKVSILFTGWYKNYWDRDNKFTNEDGNLITNQIIFDSTANRGDRPSQALVSSYVDGFATALQYMEIGDKWEIWIPWNLGYGAFQNPNSGIRGHTTLVFEIELVDIL